MNRKLIMGLLASSLIMAGCKEQGGADNASSQTVELKTMEQRMSYVIGLDMGTRFKEDGIVLDANALTRGLADVDAGEKRLMTDEEMRTTIQAYNDKRMAKMNAAQAEADAAQAVVAEANSKEGEAFLTENAEKEGVVSLPSGLQYKIVSAGTGPQPGPEDTVSVHYRGTLIDGTEFDSSYKRGQPISFPVTGVIAGWTEALQLMKEGAKWELYIPSELAYGERGTGGPIGPNATLIFEVELLKASVN